MMGSLQTWIIVFLVQVAPSYQKLNWIDCFQNGICPSFPQTDMPHQSKSGQNIKGKLPELKSATEMIFHLPGPGISDIGLPAFPENPVLQDSTMSMPLEIPSIDSVAKHLDMLPSNRKHEDIPELSVPWLNHVRNQQSRTFDLKSINKNVPMKINPVYPKEDIMHSIPDIRPSRPNKVGASIAIKPLFRGQTKVNQQRHVFKHAMFEPQNVFMHIPMANLIDKNNFNSFTQKHFNTPPYQNPHPFEHQGRHIHTVKNILPAFTNSHVFSTLDYNMDVNARQNAKLNNHIQQLSHMNLFNKMKENSQTYNNGILDNHQAINKGKLNFKKNLFNLANLSKDKRKSLGAVRKELSQNQDFASNVYAKVKSKVLQILKNFIKSAMPQKKIDKVNNELLRTLYKVKGTNKYGKSTDNSIGNHNNGGSFSKGETETDKDAEGNGKDGIEDEEKDSEDDDESSSESDSNEDGVDTKDESSSQSSEDKSADDASSSSSTSSSSSSSSDSNESNIKKGRNKIKSQQSKTQYHKMFDASNKEGQHDAGNKYKTRRNKKRRHTKRDTNGRYKTRQEKSKNDGILGLSTISNRHSKVISNWLGMGRNGRINKYNNRLLHSGNFGRLLGFDPLRKYKNLLKTRHSQVYPQILKSFRRPLKYGKFV